MSALPDGDRADEQVSSFGGKNQDAASPIGGVLRNVDKATTLQRLQGGGQCGSIHGEEGSNGAHRGWLGTIQGHQKRKLTVGQTEGTEDFIEAAGEGAGSSLDMKAETAVPHLKGRFVRQRFLS
jgi:hypothetical protein